MIQRRLPALLLLLSLLFVSSDVWAQAGMVFPRASGESSTTSSASYGAQVGLVDGASLLLLLSGVSADNESIGMLGIGGYFVGGPIVHILHGNPGKGLGSLALRVSLPLLGAGLATGFDNCDPEVTDYCGEDRMAYRIMGGMVGVIAATSIDWFLLGREKETKSPPGVQLGGVHLQPTLYPSASGAQLGVLGQF